MQPRPPRPGTPIRVSPHGPPGAPTATSEMAGELAPLPPTLKDLRDPASAAARGAPLDRPAVPNYEVLGELGRGGMGVVYLARQLSLNRLVALKMTLPQCGPADRERFRSEARAVARLRHPNVVQIYEVGEHEGRPFFSLELVEGGTLERRLAGRPLPAAQAARLALTLAQAVEAAHEQGIVHRDLKPANVLLAFSRPPQVRVAGARAPRADALATLTCGGPLNDVAPKITDFGLARHLDAAAEPPPRGEVAGTPSYMAPEQADGRTADIGPATDIYALGAILYELLTGRPPFHGETAHDTLRQVRTQEPVPPRRLQGGVPLDLETIILKCLHKEPRQRYPSALELAADLERFLEGRPILARPLGPVGRAAKWARRRPAAAALVVVSALLALSLAAAIPCHVNRLRRKVDESNAEVLRQRDASRRAHLRADCLRDLEEGRKALAHPSPAAAEDARVLSATVRGKIEADAREDPELRRIQGEASRLLEQAVRLGQRRLAREQVKEFFAWRDEAFFQLNRDLLDGPHADGPRVSREAARKALAAFPNLAHTESAEREQLLAGRVEVLLTLAEATARPWEGETEAERRARGREALRILDRIETREPGLLRAVQQRRARYLEQAGDRPGAAQARRKAESLKPETDLDWFLAGYERWLKDDVAGALADFDRALRARKPGLFWAQFFRAVGHQRLGNLSEARASLTLCIHQRPDFIWLYLLRGFLCGQCGDLEAAEKDLGTAEGLSPDGFARYVIHVNRGALALRRRQLARAIDHLQRAVVERPDGYHAHVNLAEAYRRQGDLGRSAEELDQAIRLGPRRPELYRTRARLRLQRHDPAGALSDLDQAVRLGDPGQPAQATADHLERGKILSRGGNYSAALKAFDEALRLQPACLEGHRLRGEVLLRLKRWQEAVAAFDRYLKGGRPDAEVFRQRALARAGLGDHAGVINDYSRALALRPRDPALRAARGWAYLVNEAAKPALRDFEAVLEEHPDNADAYNGRGFARVRLGQYRPAVRDADEAVRRGPHSARLLYNAARVYAQAAGAERRRPGARGPSPYEDRALKLLRSALDLLPAPERAGFWADTVRRDSAFDPLARSPGFTRLARQYGRGTGK